MVISEVSTLLRKHLDEPNMCAILYTPDVHTYRVLRNDLNLIVHFFCKKTDLEV